MCLVASSASGGNSRRIRAEFPTDNCVVMDEVEYILVASECGGSS